MGKGAIHYTGSNFPRVPRLDVVQRMRLLVQQEAVQRPAWLQAAERSPPLELLNIKMLDRRVPNKYLELTREVLRKYPNMRFADCFVDGNDWSKGNDTYRADHPVMQFVALQLRLMNLGLSQRAAFHQAEKAFYARRIALEKQQKLSMAAAVVGAVARDPAAATAAAATAAGNTAATRGGGGAAVPTSSLARTTAMGLGEVQPLFTSGQAYWQFSIAQSQANHLLRIRQVLRRMRSRASAAAEKEAASVALAETTATDSSGKAAAGAGEAQRDAFPSLRQRTFSAAGRRSRAALLQQHQQQMQQPLAQRHPRAQASTQISAHVVDPRLAAAAAAPPAYYPSAAAASPPAYSSAAAAVALPPPAAEGDYWEEGRGEGADPAQWLVDEEEAAGTDWEFPDEQPD